jgi:hypothetical protein
MPCPGHPRVGPALDVGSIIRNLKATRRAVTVKRVTCSGVSLDDVW